MQLSSEAARIECCSVRLYNPLYFNAITLASGTKCLKISHSVSIHIVVVCLPSCVTEKVGKDPCCRAARWRRREVVVLYIMDTFLEFGDGQNLVRRLHDLVIRPGSPKLQ